MSCYVVRSESPCEDDADDVSEPPDAEAEIGRRRLYIISKTGSGEVRYLVIDSTGEAFQTYQTRSETWKQTKNISDFGVIVLDNYLYIVGGLDKLSGKYVTKVMRYSLAEDVWLRRFPMRSARCKFGISATNNCILVAGGEIGKGQITAMCESYDPRSNLWTRISNLPSPRRNPTCVAHDGLIYCVGGIHDGNNHTNMWVFEDHRWSNLDPHCPVSLLDGIDRCGAVLCGGTIYLVGGIGSSDNEEGTRRTFASRDSLISFNCAVSALRQEQFGEVITPWNFHLPALNEARHNAAVVVLGTKLYVIGGSVLGEGGSVQTVERYDVLRNTWKTVFRFKKGDYSHVDCAVLDSSYITTKKKDVGYKLKWVIW